MMTRKALLIWLMFSEQAPRLQHHTVTFLNGSNIGYCDIVQ